jgi:hypothetical protein
LARIIDFGTNAPGAVIGTAVIYCEQGVDDQGKPVCSDPTGVGLGDESGLYKVVQSTEGGSTSPLMDMFMLVDNPTRWSWIFPIAPPNPSGGAVILRNVNFAADPNIQAVSAKGNSSGGFPIWQVFDNQVPAGTLRIFASGGAVHPVLFAYTSAGQLFRRLNGSWEALDVGASLPSVWRGNEGPVFVNPYDPHHLFVVTTKDVRVSRSGVGDTLIFAPDESLMQLLTASGKYSWNGSFGTVNEDSQAPILAPSHAKGLPRNNRIGTALRTHE